MRRAHPTRRAFISSTLIVFAAPAIIPAARLMPARMVPELDRPSAGFALRLFLDTRARAIAELEYADWPLDRIGVELGRRGLDDLNGKAWTPSRLTQVASSARRLGLVPPPPPASSTTLEGRSWSG